MSRVARPNSQRPTAGRGTGRGAGRGAAAEPATGAAERHNGLAALTPGHARIHGFNTLNAGTAPPAPPARLARPPGAADAGADVGRVQNATGAAPLPENFTRAQDFISAVHERYGPGGPEFNLPPPARQAPPATRPAAPRGAGVGPLPATATRPGPYLTGTTVRGTAPGGRRLQDGPSPSRTVSAQRGFGKTGAKVGAKGRAAALEAAEERARQAHTQDQ